jgi:transposase
MPAWNHISPKRRDAAVRLYEKLQSVKEVSETLGMGAASVRRFVREAGLLRPRGRPRVATPSRDYILELHKWYGNAQDVAEILGVSRATVYNRLTGKF